MLQSSSPSHATLNALSYYLMVSLFFVFGAMMEFALVLAIKGKSSDEPTIYPDGRLFKNQLEEKLFRKRHICMISNK